MADQTLLYLQGKLTPKEQDRKACQTCGSRGISQGRCVECEAKHVLSKRSRR